jgi:hypothetical protein
MGQELLIWWARRSFAYRVCAMGQNHELKLPRLSTFAPWGENRFVGFRDLDPTPWGKTQTQGLGEMTESIHPFQNEHLN